MCYDTARVVAPLRPIHSAQISGRRDKIPSFQPIFSPLVADVDSSNVKLKCVAVSLRGQSFGARFKLSPPISDSTTLDFLSIYSICIHLLQNFIIFFSISTHLNMKIHYYLIYAHFVKVTWHWSVLNRPSPTGGTWLLQRRVNVLGMR